MADKLGGYRRPTATSYISSSYQDHRNRTPPSGEPGTDYGCAYGSTLYAPEDGTIVDLSHSTAGAHGRFITIDFNDGQRGRALHLKSISVQKGQKVKRGQVIGQTGASAYGREWGVGAHVHQTLWRNQAYTFGRNATIDFERYVGADNDGGVSYNQDVANRQAWLNQSRGAKLVVDGLLGPLTIKEIKEYQEFLRKYGYNGAIDGIWGNGTQAAHQKYYNEYHADSKPNTSKYHKVTLNDIASLKDVRGLQKIAKLYGYRGGLDNKWGNGSKAGFQKFLNQNYGGSLTTWLRQRWGYKDKDDLFGPNMKAALERANKANWEQL